MQLLRGELSGSRGTQCRTLCKVGNVFICFLCYASSAAVKVNCAEIPVRRLDVSFEKATMCQLANASNDKHHNPRANAKVAGRGTQVVTTRQEDNYHDSSSLFPLVRGEIFGTRVIAWRGALSSRGVCLWHGVVTSSGWRGTGAEHGGGEGWALAEFVCGTESWRHRGGEGLVRSMVAGSAELSRSLFVARSRDVIGMERDWCGAWWRGAWALAEFVCGTESWCHRDGEGLVRSMVAGSAEISRSLFVARSRDVIGMERDWCGAWWRGGLSSRGVCLWHGFWRHPDAALARLLCQSAKVEGKVVTFCQVYV